MTTGETADLYLRISEDTKGLQMGVDRQEESCRDLCERMGWTVRNVWRDNDVSATRSKFRPQFEAMIASRPRRIVMWSVDRLVRKGPDLERLIELDVPVHSVMAGPMDLSTASGRLNARLLTSVATFEGEIKAERQQAAALQRAKMGKPWWPRRPVGFNMDGTLHEEEAKVLAECYRLLLAGSSIADLARVMNQHDIQTNKGKSWTASSLRPVLLNARNAGIRTYKSVQMVSGAWEAIVPEETYFDAVRLLSDERRRTGGGGTRKFLLTNIASCGVCGGPVKVNWRGRKANPNAYPVYACRHKHCASHRVVWVDRFVRALAIRALEDEASVMIWMGSESNGAEEVRAEVVRLRAKMHQHEDDYADDIITRDQFIRMSSKIKDRLNEAEMTLAQFTGTSPIAPLLKAKNPAAAWKNLTLSRERAALSFMFDRIALLPLGRGNRIPTVDHVIVELRGKKPVEETA